MARYLNDRIETLRGDITRLSVDAIVNAANSSLLGGGGVDGAIHRAAGPGLLDECRGLGGARPGEAKITRGHRLPARHVLHTVGPVWRGGSHGEDGTLARCYRECLRLAADRELKTVAFPAISTGAYRFPIERATRIALVEARSGLAHHRGLERIVFCCFSDSDLAVYDAAAQELFGSSAGEPSTPSPA
jgi:O-acetyl-ADP-ribose deacetylase (regulator of RNase III)